MREEVFRRRRRVLGSHVVARLAARGSALILRFAYRARVSALDQVDGIERAVDRVIAPKRRLGNATTSQPP